MRWSGEKKWKCIVYMNGERRGGGELPAMTSTKMAPHSLTDSLGGSAAVIIIVVIRASVDDGRG